MNAPLDFSSPEEAVLWLEQNARAFFESVMPTIILDQANRRLAIGIAPPAKPGSRLEFLPDSSVEDNLVIAAGATLVQSDGKRFIVQRLERGDTLPFIYQRPYFRVWLK